MTSRERAQTKSSKELKPKRQLFVSPPQKQKEGRSRTYIIRERRPRRRSEEKRTMIGAIKE
jgi:hypothetical protein